MLYVIDNNEDFDDHIIYFVEAPDSFGEWFKKVLVPWQRERFERMKTRLGYRVHSLMCAATIVGWYHERRPISASSYIEKNGFMRNLSDGPEPYVP